MNDELKIEVEEILNDLKNSLFRDIETAHAKLSPKKDEIKQIIGEIGFQILDEKQEAEENFKFSEKTVGSMSVSVIQAEAKLDVLRALDDIFSYSLGKYGYKQVFNNEKQ